MWTAVPNGVQTQLNSDGYPELTYQLAESKQPLLHVNFPAD